MGCYGLKPGNNLRYAPISLEGVGNIHHPAFERAGSVVGLLYGLVRIGECSNKAQCEILVELPIGVRVEFEKCVRRGNAAGQIYLADRR